MNSRKQLSATKGPSRGRGVSLIEALVALVVIAVGMLALAQVQIQLRLNADLSRQRAEAVRIAQEDMENWRAFSRLTTTAGKVAYADIVSQARTAVTGQANTNTTYFLTRSVTVNATPGYKAMKVTVDWTTRTGATESIVVDSLIGQTDPTLAAQLAIPPSGTPIRNPLNRNVRIPATAIDLGNGKSGITPPGGNVFYVFSNVNASVIERCNVSISDAAAYASAVAANQCATVNGYLVSGFVNFDLRNNISAVSPGTSVCEFYADAQSGNLLSATTTVMDVNSVTLDRASMRPANERPLREYQANVVSVATTSGLKDGQAAVSTSANLVVSLVSAGSGSVNNPNSATFVSTSGIVLRNMSTSTDVETFTPTAIGAQTVTRSGGGASYTALDSSTLALTIDPSANLSNNTVYRLTIPAGAIRLARNSNFDTNSEIVVTFSTGTAPSLVSTSPADGGTISAVTSNITMTFDRNIAGGIGIVTLYKKANGNNFSIVETFNMGSSGAGGSGGSATISGSTLTINPGADLLATSDYAIGIEAGAIRDTNGISYAGISDYTTFNFSTSTGSVSATCPTSGTVKDFLGATFTSLSNNPSLGLTQECFSDSKIVVTSSSNLASGFFCAVYTTQNAQVSWSGSLNLLGPDGWLTGGSSRYKVCRYYNSNGDGTVTNFEHPNPYTNVSESLTDQNFLVIGKNQSCPNETVNVGSQTGVTVYFSTSQIQP
jgi:Tfp pilus assembly protein PilV